MSMWKIQNDISQIIAANQIHWHTLRDSNLLITGGTGFIGRWLLETLLYANEHLALNLKITVPSRDPDVFYNKNRHLFLSGNLTVSALDITKNKPSGRFTHIIHAAADASTSLNDAKAISMFDTIVHGTKNLLELAASVGTSKFLFLSTGAVYGQQPDELAAIPENWTGVANKIIAKNVYSESKRAAEMLCSIYKKEFGIDIVVARIFSLLGPFISLNTHFAAGNFIRDALEGQQIVVKSSGRAIRSYLYPSDLVAWLLTLLTRQPRESTYNIGSMHAVSISELAQLVAELIGKNGYQILGQNDAGWNTGRYIPNTTLIRSEFGLTETRSLEYAVLSTAAAAGS